MGSVPREDAPDEACVEGGREEGGNFATVSKFPLQVYSGLFYLATMSKIIRDLVGPVHQGPR